MARIADFWCRFMHDEPMWPTHGWYECRTCRRRHPVRWEKPSSATPDAMVLPRETQAPKPFSDDNIGLVQA
jgi:hypothetical protein